MQDRLIIIPDIHGRRFWRDALEDFPFDRFIFLGDYLDPYPGDTNSCGNGFTELMDIVAFKEAHPEDVILLLGNHDLHYIKGSGVRPSSRYDAENAALFGAFFKAHLGAFQLAYETQAGGKRFLFTHAGVVPRWAERAFGSRPFGAPEINAMLCTYRSYLLDKISILRGGEDYYGSPVWADIREFKSAKDSFAPLPEDLVQVFGHTFSPSGQVNIGNRFFDLDCGEYFYMDTVSGDIFDSKGMAASHYL